MKLQDYEKAEIILRELVGTRNKLIEDYGPELAEALII